MTPLLSISYNLESWDSPPAIHSLVCHFVSEQEVLSVLSLPICGIQARINNVATDRFHHVLFNRYTHITNLRNITAWTFGVQYNNNNNNRRVFQLFVNCVTNKHVCLLLIIVLEMTTHFASQDTLCNWIRRENVVLDYRPTSAIMGTSILLSMRHPLFVASYIADTLKRKQAILFIVSE